MNNHYHDLHHLSKLYREEALREANKRHLITLAKADREQPSTLSRVGLRCNRLLSLLLSPETSRSRPSQRVKEHSEMSSSEVRR